MHGMVPREEYSTAFVSSLVFRHHLKTRDVAFMFRMGVTSTLLFDSALQIVRSVYRSTTTQEDNAWR